MFLFICVCAAGWIAAQEETNEQLDDVEITGEATDKVTIEKISPDIKIEIKNLVDSVTDKTEKLLEKGKPVPSPDDFKRFDHLESEQTARPWLVEFSEPPLISFFPSMSETTVKRWRLEVTDEQGNIIKTINGKGNPVKEIEWAGLDTKGDIISVGRHYSYRFITEDEFKVSHTTLGKAFILNNLRYQDLKNLYLEISSGVFFDEIQIRPEARELFEQVLDTLREYSKYPFTVELYADDPHSELVRKRRENIVNEIAEKMLILPEDVRYTYSRIGERGDIIRFVIRKRKI